MSARFSRSAISRAAVSTGLSARGSPSTWARSSSSRATRSTFDLLDSMGVRGELVTFKPFLGIYRNGQALQGLDGPGGKPQAPSRGDEAPPHALAAREAADAQVRGRDAVCFQKTRLRRPLQGRGARRNLFRRLRERPFRRRVARVRYTTDLPVRSPSASRRIFPRRTALRSPIISCPA